MKKQTTLCIIIAIVAIGLAMAFPYMYTNPSSPEIVVGGWFSIGPVVKAQPLPASSYLDKATMTITTDSTVVSVYGMPTVTLGEEVLLSRCGRRCMINGKTEIVVGRRHQ